MKIVSPITVSSYSVELKLYLSISFIFCVIIIVPPCGKDILFGDYILPQGFYYV